jgi:Protein of unknown function (DUF2844)
MRIKFCRVGPVLAASVFGFAAQLCLQSPAFANLGGDVRSVSADRDMMQGRLRSTSMQHYTMHEITTSGGTVVREYETLQGKIFAVTWQGPFPPNLQQLFGGYYDQFQTAAAASAQAHPGMHRQLSVAQPDFVVQTLGRMRSFHGKACVPSLVPSGISVADLP